MMTKILIEQLGQEGEVNRTFTRLVWPHEVDQALEDIARGFNMDRTRVTVEGQQDQADTRVACARCGSLGFNIRYDPAAQGKHVECSGCGEVAFL